MQKFSYIVAPLFGPSLRRAAITALVLAHWATPAPAQQVLPVDELPARVGDLSNQGQGSATGGVDGHGGVITLQQRRASDPAETSEATALQLPPQHPYRPSEFERYVNSIAPQASASAELVGGGTATGITSMGSSPVAEPIRRFGANLVTDVGFASSTLDPLPAVPDDYIVKSGDEIALTIWGSADANLRLTVDRAGMISIPRVGAVSVAGLRYADLTPALIRRVGETFKGFQLTASLGRLRAVRVFVSGYVEHPGSISLSAISSVLQALMRAGGPSQAGSFRDIRLTRRGKLIATYDLYDLLLKGDRRADELVQPDDVIFVGPARTQVALLGSVQQQAIFELLPQESLADALRMAGGFTPVADRSRVSLERLADRIHGHVVQLTLPEHAADHLQTGDVINVYSIVTSALPKDRQNERVHVDGEVALPGDYLLPAGSTIADALRLAGGMTSKAYPYGAEFTRRSVRMTQQANYDRALRELEANIAKNDATTRVTTAEEATARTTSASSNRRLLETLRALRPSGRIVLELGPDDLALPDLQLEDGDTLHIPSRDTAVGVFGSVFNSGSFLFMPHRTTEQYLRLAGGPTRGADKHSMFVIHANGSVVSAQQGASFWHPGNEFQEAEVLPGDTIFVPEELNKSTFVHEAKDWTQILYQFGLGLAGIKALGL